MFLTDAEQWATKTFSQADLGDLRRTKRLVKLTASLADHIGQSIVQSLKSPSDIEAAYRFTRNQAIDTQSIAQAGFAATAELSHAYECLLALEDTTSLNFTHRTVRDEMGYTSSKKSATGMQAHSVLLFAPNEE
ncbi:MAG: IS4/Tn5 family transposase DNA-binding protein, partial [Enterovibrio sp.]